MRSVFVSAYVCLYYTVIQMTLHFFFYFIVHIVFDFDLSAVTYIRVWSLFIVCYVLVMCLYLSSLYVATSMLFFLNTMSLVYLSL